MRVGRIRRRLRFVPGLSRRSSVHVHPRIPALSQLGVHVVRQSLLVQKLLDLGLFLKERRDIGAGDEGEIRVEVAVVDLTLDAEEAGALVPDLLLDATRRAGVLEVTL